MEKRPSETQLKDDDEQASITAISIITNDYEGDDEVEQQQQQSMEQDSKELKDHQSSSESTSMVELSKAVKPAVFRRPPKLTTDSDSLVSLASAQKDSPTKLQFNTDINQIKDKWIKRGSPISSSTMATASATSLTSNDGQKASISSLSSFNSPHRDQTPKPLDDRRRSIPTMNPLRPAFSSENDLNREAGTEQPASAVSDPLTQDEYELLMKLEQQNQMLNSDPNSFMRDILASQPSGAELSPETANGEVAPDNRSDLQEEVDWDFWGKFLNDYDNTLKKQGRVLLKKIHQGIPKAVRGSIWHSFCRSHPYSFLRMQANPEPDNSSVSVTSNASSSSPVRDKFKPPDAFIGITLEDAYVELLKLSSPYEKMIIRDLARTFPKHDFFKHADGIGQESLFNVMKAYSLYDSEVGYCQGLSFIVGALLLHMPDEQAFSCLVHLMHTYQLRGLFTPRMELLQLRLFQFDKLLQEVLPRVNEHLLEEGIRSTMYASQWFLTLFSYRFPLDFVFRVMDIIFATGIVSGASGAEGGVMDVVMERVSEVASGLAAKQEMGTESALVLFRFAFALLKKNEEMILALDFEPLLEFLKNGLFQIYTGEPIVMQPGAKSPQPLRYRSVSRKAIDDLVRDATSSQFKQITKKRLMQLRKDYDEELKKTDPAYLQEKSLEQQNHRLINDLKRSEKMLAELNKDHCDLASQLVTLRVELAKEREVSDALRRQVADLKEVMKREIKSFEVESLTAVIDHEVTLENASEEIPRAKEDENARLPSLEEQISILTKQNINLLEEAQVWRRKAEQFEKQLKSLSATAQPSTSSMFSPVVQTGDTSLTWQNLSKRFLPRVAEPQPIEQRK